MEIPVAIFYEVLQRHVMSKHEARILDAKFQLMEEMVSNHSDTIYVQYNSFYLNTIKLKAILLVGLCIYN
jgi:hypothetical protein